MPISFDAAGNATITGDNGTYSIPNGALTVTVNGSVNTISGGTGTNTYNLVGDANALTTGSAFSNVTYTDTNPTLQTPSSLNVGDGGLNTVLNGRRFSVTSGLGQVYLRGDFTDSTITVRSDNLQSNAYVLGRSGNVLQGGQGNDTIAISSDSSISINSDGIDTYIISAGNAGLGPRLNAFTPGQDNLAILLNPASGFGLSDLGLAPASFLSASQFEGASATSNLASTRFLYDPATGELKFSPQGSLGPTYGVARLPAGLTLQANQIFIANQFVYGAPTQYVLDVTPTRSGFTTAINPEGNGAPVARFAVTDTGTNLASSAEPGQVLVNDPNGLAAQFVYNGANVIAVATQTTENVFVKSISTAGSSALAGGAGNDVLDGGLGSVFLTGGAGRDFFFTDARQSAFVWTTVTDFSAAEIVTLYGFVQGRDSFQVLAQPQGAAGYQGITLEANVNGTIARVTLSGRAAGDFVVSYGQNGGGDYLAINSVIA